MHRDRTMPTVAKPLTDRQRRFAEAFVDMEPEGGRLCAAKAARLAGFAWPRPPFF
jgi:hypothetical protein